MNATVNANENAMENAIHDGTEGAAGHATTHSSQYHLLDVPDVVEALRTDVSQGLSSDEAAARLKRYGPNELRETPGPTVLHMLMEQITEPLVLVLIAAAAVSVAVREVSEGLVIMAIVVLNAVLGVVQESRAEKSLAALKKLAAPLARVRRDGVTRTVPARELVPGDVVLIEAGDHVPADIRLTHAATLKAEEAALTGESVPVEKGVEALPLTGGEVAVADRTNMLHMATICVYGRGQGVVVATGMGTQVGRIAGLIESAVEKQTPLQERMEGLGKLLGGAALGLCGLMFLAGLLRGIRVFEMFLTSVSLAVAAIPEGLPAIVTIVLAIGVQRMARRRAIIRKLPAVETLGSATAICSDKTGTLTENQMTVVKAYVNGQLLEVTGQGYSPEGELVAAGAPVRGSDPHIAMLARIAALCNNAELRHDAETGEWQVIGDPTEGALVVLARKAGLGLDDAAAAPRVGEIPFDSVRKRMTTFNRLGDRTVALVKGAPDSVLGRCTHVFEGGAVRPLTDARREEIARVNAQMAAGALRVLACAYRDLGEAGAPARADADDVERDLVFVGLTGLMDPPRAEVPAAVRLCRDAGIVPIMITGDHKNTAMAVAQAIGLVQAPEPAPGQAAPGQPMPDRGVPDLHAAGAQSEVGPGPRVALSGSELDALADEELAAAVRGVSIYARVSPEHKVRIVEALQRQGHVVAMTGDGVNDAPALKRADIGCAMGITGTDVAKEASDMVLADDNFATIVEAVRQGRAIFDNVRRSISYLVSCNIGEILATFIAVVTGGFRPLTPIQLLWVNLVTDSLPALALGVEPPEAGIMARPPRKRHESVFGRGGALRIALYGAFIGALTLVAFHVGLGQEDMTGRDPVLAARTMAFAALSLCQLFHAFNFRSTTGSLLRLGPFTNKYLVGAWVVSSAVQLSVLMIPGLRPIFDTVALTWPEWGVVWALSFSPIVFGELLKAVERARRREGR